MPDVITPKCSNGYCEVPGDIFEMKSESGNLKKSKPKTVVITGFKLKQTEVSVGEYKASGTKLKAVLSGCGSKKVSEIIIAENGESESELRKRALSIFSKKSCEDFRIFKPMTKNVPDFAENKQGNNYPIVGLSFDQKRAYCQEQGGDLPTAAQLHFAARHDGGEQYADKLIILDNLSSTDFHSLFENNKSLPTRPVIDGYQNAYGIYNLLGNVWESTLDVYDRIFYRNMSSQDPSNLLTNPEEELGELVGGSVLTTRVLASPGSRYKLDSPSDYKEREDIGFRCARPLPEAERKQEDKKAVKK